MTQKELEERLDHFFILYETELKFWTSEEYDPDVDYFDLENLFISRYWLHKAKDLNMLNEEQLKKLQELDKQFKEKKIAFIGLLLHIHLAKWLVKEDINEVNNCS